MNYLFSIFLLLFKENESDPLVFFLLLIRNTSSDKGTLCIYNFRPSTYVLVLVLAFPFGLVKLVQCLSWSWLCLLD